MWSLITKSSLSNFKNVGGDRDDDHTPWQMSPPCTHTWANLSVMKNLTLYSLRLSIYIKMGVQMFVCMLVCGGLMEIQTPAPILMKFCTHIPTCPRKVSVQVWPPSPHPLGLRGWGGLETLKAEGHIFKMLSRLQINPGSAGYLS